MKHTTKCIICLKKTVVFGGHVLLDNGQSVFAGFCKDHIDSTPPNLMKRRGCYGGWHKKYGLTK